MLLYLQFGSVHCIGYSTARRLRTGARAIHPSSVSEEILSSSHAIAVGAGTFVVVLRCDFVFEFRQVPDQLDRCANQCSSE